MTDRRYWLLLWWERRRLALSESWWAFRCERLHRCPGCNWCDPPVCPVDGRRHEGGIHDD